MKAKRAHPRNPAWMSQLFTLKQQVFLTMSPPSQSLQREGHVVVVAREVVDEVAAVEAAEVELLILPEAPPLEISFNRRPEVAAEEVVDVSKSRTMHASKPCITGRKTSKCNSSKLRQFSERPCQN